MHADFAAEQSQFIITDLKLLINNLNMLIFEIKRCFVGWTRLFSLVSNPL